MKMTDQQGMSDYRENTVVVAHLHSGDSITGAFASSLDDLWRNDDRVLFPPIRNQGNSDIAAGRKQLVEAFLWHTRGEWLLMLDDDMGFEHTIVDTLLSVADPVHAPVVGGLAFTQRRYELTTTKAQRFLIRPTIYRAIETANDFGYAAVAEYPKDTCIEVDGTGAACLLVHRSVYERMYVSDNDWVNRGQWFEPVVVPKGPETGRKRFSEDLSFCFRLKNLGIPIHVHTGAHTCHMKPVYLDEWYFENQPLRTQEPEVAIIGTGRSGTGFIADAMSLLGIQFGHEGYWNVFGTRAPGMLGDSSWIATNYMDDYAGKVWHQVRHPLHVINSLIGNELFEADAPGWVKPFEEERKRWAGYETDDDVLVKALRVVAHWWTVADKHATRTWRLEDMTPGLLVELCAELGRDVDLQTARSVIERLGTGVNKHVHRVTITWDDLPDNDDKFLIEEMAAQFGYDLGEEVGAGPESFLVAGASVRSQPEGDDDG